MKKKLFYSIIALLSIVLIVVALNMSTADDPVPYELALTEYNALTSIGAMDLPVGSLIGGSPENYITLTQQTTMETTSGTRTLDAGTKIRCGDPGYPPCNPY